MFFLRFWGNFVSMQKGEGGRIFNPLLEMRCKLIALEKNSFGVYLGNIHPQHCATRKDKN